MPVTMTGSRPALRSISVAIFTVLAASIISGPSWSQDADPAEAGEAENPGETPGTTPATADDTADLPEVDVTTPFESTTPAKPKKAAAQASSPAATTVSPSVVSAAPEPSDGEGSGGDVAAREPAEGEPGTGTTGIDGYIARGTSTATKTNTPLKDIPQSISVVTAEEAADRGSEGLGEALQYVPGVTVAQGEGHRDQISIRGQVTTADFFVDGVRDDIQYYRDLYNVQAVEILKGASAMTFGRGGGGGIVNRVTKKADGTRVREATFNTGMYDRKRVTLDVGDKLTESSAFRLNAMYEDSENFRDFFELERYGINPKVAFGLGERTLVSLSYEYFNDDRTVDRGVPSFNGRPSRGPIETFFGNPDVSFANFESHVLTATIDHQTGFGLNIRNHTSYADYDKLYQNIFATSEVTGGTLTIGGYQDGTDRQSIFNQTDLSYIYDLGGGIRHTLAAGAEFSRQETDNFRNEPRFFDAAVGPTSLVVPFASPTSFAPVFFSRPTRNRATEVDVSSGYIQDQLEISKYLEIIGGLRFDRFDIAFRNGLTGETLSRVDEVWSHRVGAVIKPLPELSLYVSTANSFLPGAGDQFNNLSLVNGRTLAPEEFKNREIGFKWEAAPRLFLTAAVYTLDRSNQIITSGPFTGQQVGLTTTDGGELALTGYVTDDWQISAAWGRQFAEVIQGNDTRVGNTVPFVPEDVISIWNKYRFTSFLSAGVGVIHQTSSFASLDNTVELPSFTRVDAAVYLDLGENWDAQVNIENLLDEDYFASAHNNNNISPGAPLSAYVTVRAKY